MDDIIKSLNLTSPKIFKAPCFRENLHYDVSFKDVLESSFDDLAAVDDLYKFAITAFGPDWKKEPAKTRRKTGE